MKNEAHGSGCRLVLAVARFVGAADAPGGLVPAAAKSLAWKLSFWWTLAPAAALFLASLRLPESPAWGRNGERGRGNGERGRGNGERGTVNGERDVCNGTIPHSPPLPPLRRAVSTGRGGADAEFFFFAANGAAYFAVSLLIPETKGKSLDELEHIFDNRLQSKNRSCGTHDPAGWQRTVGSSVPLDRNKEGVVRHEQ